jgi:hypothetical protein
MPARLLCVLVACLAPNFAASADPVPPLSHFYDEEGRRLISIREEPAGAVEVELRVSGEPGLPWRWRGDGRREGRSLQFTRIVGEEEDRGPVYSANVGIYRWGPMQVDEG